MSRPPTYPEELLHWVWKTTRLESDCLKTVTGEPVSIFNVGKLNKADGPDFLNAHIQIGKLEWFGDVEIHWSEKDWNHHGHHADPSYNRVVLHVVWYHNPGGLIQRQDQTSIPTLVIKNSLPSGLKVFLEQYLKPERLPCSGHIPFISEQAFEQQIKKAKRQYFEQKVDDLLKFWDSSLPPSRAWQKMLAMGLSDGLGISHNREALHRLCLELYSCINKINSKAELIALAISKSGIKAGRDSNCFTWMHKGSRPSNHPEVRIRQAASYLWFINQFPFKAWLKEEPIKLWEQLNEQMLDPPGPGKQRKDILYGTVWLPSLFILGNTFASNSLQTNAYTLWENHRPKIPSSLLKPFQCLDIPASLYSHSLGAVHQLRSYCLPGHCERCKVFKSAISS